MAANSSPKVERSSINISRLYEHQFWGFSPGPRVFIHREKTQQLYATLKRLEDDQEIPPWFMRQRMAYTQTIAITGSLLAAVVATSFSFPHIESAPWPVSALWWAALHTSILSVYVCVDEISVMESKLRRASRWFNQDRVRTLIALLELEQAFIMISASGVLYLIGGWIYILAPLGKGVWTGTQKAAALYLGLIIGIAGAAVLLGVILGMILLRMKEKIAERTETWFAQILYYLFGIST